MEKYERETFRLRWVLAWKSGTRVDWTTERVCWLGLVALGKLALWLAR